MRYNGNQSSKERWQTPKVVTVLQKASTNHNQITTMMCYLRSTLGKQEKRQQAQIIERRPERVQASQYVPLGWAAIAHHRKGVKIYE